MSDAPRVTCFVDTDLVHSAYAVAGLIELAEQGEIQLDFRLRYEGLRRPRGPFTLFITVNGTPVCLDFHDGNAYYCRASLAACRLYYKANWNRGGQAGLTEAEQAKVRRFGPYTPCKARADRAFLFRAVGNAFVHIQHRFLSPGRRTTVLDKLAEAKHIWIGRYRRYRQRKVWADYESGTTLTSVNPRTAEPLVFFNPSCWAESSEENEATNRLRADLIVGLRNELGRQFMGGFRSNALAAAKYPEALEERTYSHQEYVQLLQTAPISIYTNGLSGCFSWRLIENFAGARAIVSETLVNDPGYELGEAQGFIERESAGEMIEAVLALRADAEGIQALQEAAWATYVAQMRPPVQMRALIDELVNAEEQPVAPNVEEHDG